MTIEVLRSVSKGVEFIARRRVLASIGVVLIGALATQLQSVRAEGAPDRASQPLTYSGTLEEDGAPATGQKTVRLELYSDAVLADTPSRKCSVGPVMTAFEKGTFRVALDEACLAAVQANPNLWVSIEVAGNVLPRKKLGAVPYAMEATHAVTASGASGSLAAMVVPAGAVMAFDLDACPSGWEAYAAAQGRTVVGSNPAGNELSVRTRGQKLGEETHVMLVKEVPPHKHQGTTSSANRLGSMAVVHQAGSGWQPNHMMGHSGGAVTYLGETDWPFSAHTHNFETDNGPGTAAPHNTMQPSLVLLYCRKQ